MAANDICGPGISTLEIKDEALARGAHAIYSPRNCFIAYGAKRDNKSKSYDYPQYLHEITPKSALYNDYIRKLVNETQNIFLTLNSKAEDLAEEKEKLEISRTSKLYRSVLIACIEELHVCPDKDTEEILSLKQMFQDIELLWHLIHVLVIDIYSGSSLLCGLLEWIEWHFVSPEKNFEAIMNYEDGPHSHPDYWDTLIQFLLHGKIKAARSLLYLHDNREREDFQSIDDLLQRMPMNSVCNRISVHEFRLRWKYWQEECKTRLSRGEFSADENLKTICKVLCGDYETLTNKSYLCENWYVLMISVLLYTDPCLNLNSLGDLARTYHNNVNTPSSNRSSLVDSIILAAMELDIMNVVKSACFFNDGWWFAVHIMDLLYHGNYIKTDFKNEYPKQFRSSLLTNYGDSLMSHRSLWQVGIQYLDYCSESRELIELYLERIPLNTEATARKVIHIAMKRNIDSLVKSVANVMTSRALSNGMLGTALSWIKYSKDVRFADEIADRWMKSYINERKMEGFEIFRTMGSCMLVSDKLSFLGKYCEFHTLYGEGKLKQAASLLLALLSSNLAPPNFQFIMLLDAIPLLEANDVLFTSNETFYLMQYLEDCVLDLESKPVSEERKETKVMRLALVRNLARAFVNPTDDSDSDYEL